MCSRSVLVIKYDRHDELNDSTFLFRPFSLFVVYFFFSSRGIIDYSNRKPSIGGLPVQHRLHDEFLRLAAVELLPGKSQLPMIISLMITPGFTVTVSFLSLFLCGYFYIIVSQRHELR